MAIALVLVASQAVAGPTEEMCEAVTIAKESRGESLEGSRAVLSTLRNRMRIDKMTACEVVTAKGQFSWYRASQATPYKWKISKKHLTRYHKVRMMSRKMPPTVYYFHSGKRKGKWGRYYKTIGRHKFYHIR